MPTLTQILQIMEDGKILSGADLDTAPDWRIVPAIPGQASTEQEPCGARSRIHKSQRLVREGAYFTEQDAQDLGNVPVLLDATADSDLHAADLRPGSASFAAHAAQSNLGTLPTVCQFGVR